MALYYFICECGNEFRKILDSDDEIKTICPKCKSDKIIRESHPINVQQKEILDDGRMYKKIERFVNAQELYKNRDK